MPRLMFIAITNAYGWGRASTRAAAIAKAKAESATFSKVTEVITYQCVEPDAYVDAMGYIHGVDPDSIHRHPCSTMH
jgi:hypothetical protein